MALPSPSRYPSVTPRTWRTSRGDGAWVSRIGWKSAKGSAAMTIEVPYRSIPDMFLRRVAATPDKRAFGRPGPDGQQRWQTWREIGDEAQRLAAGLTTIGVGHEDRVAILASTRVEWIIADLAIMCAGGATTTVYPTTEPEDACYIVSDSGSRVVIAENKAQAAKLTAAPLPDVTHIVLIDGDA